MSRSTWVRDTLINTGVMAAGADADRAMAEVRAEVLAEGLSESERAFLTFALGLAADVMASRGDEFTAEDEAALTSLSRMAMAPAAVPVPDETAGDETGEADVDTVAARAAAAISAMGADLRAARKERDRYRNAWQNARTRAADGWADAAKAEADVAELRDLERRVTEQLEDFEDGLEVDPGAPAVAHNMTQLLARAVRGES